MSSPPGPPAEPAEPDAADVAAAVQKRPFDLMESVAATAPPRASVAFAPAPAPAATGATAGKKKGYDPTKKEEATRLGVTFFCADGTYVICGICSGSEECGGLRVNLRAGRLFDLGCFYQHLNKGTHAKALANIEAEKETGTFKKQKTLFSGGFSGVAPKVKGPKSSAKEGTVQKKLPPPPPPPRR